MKVGIITLLGTNYGGTLQAYALKHSIEKLNIKDVSIINYTLENKIKLKSIVKKIVYYNRNTKFRKFKSNYLNLTKKVNSEQLKENELKFDAYIAGSDQIWNQQIPMMQRKNFYLDFVKNAKKIAYAASIGRETFEDTEKHTISKYLNRFDYISIRESTGVKLYQPLTKNKIENVLDPTLLLTAEEWNQVEKNIKINKDYIFSYTLGAEQNIIRNIDKFAEKLKLGIVEISYKRNFKNEIKNINNAGPEEFIGLIKEAKYVMTNSFHGIVFSILYKKNFWVFKRGKMNSRIYDLLRILNLQDRIIDIENTNIINLKEKINYEEVFKALEEERKKSYNFLKRALDIEE